MKKIQTSNAPAAIGPYSQAIEANGFVYTSGQLGIDPTNGELPESFEAQAELSLKNLGAILEEAGLSYDNVVKTTFNAIYSKYFANCPARSCIEVAALPKGALVEVEAVAAK